METKVRIEMLPDLIGHLHEWSKTRVPFNPAYYAHNGVAKESLRIRADCYSESIELYRQLIANGYIEEESPTDFVTLSSSSAFSLTGKGEMLADYFRNEHITHSVESTFSDVGFWTFPLVEEFIKKLIIESYTKKYPLS